MFCKNTYSQSWGQSSYNITEATSFAPWVYFSCNKNYGHSSGTYNRCLRPGSLWTNSIICGSSFGQPCLTSHGLGMIAYEPNSTSTTLLELHVRCLLQCTGPICLVRTIGRYWTHCCGHSMVTCQMSMKIKVIYVILVQINMKNYIAYTNILNGEWHKYLYTRSL